ncbi:uncharacterized protein ASCRUDRAFT_76606, partial [Ascoidea rubescens DSM 1968]
MPLLRIIFENIDYYLLIPSVLFRIFLTPLSVAILVCSWIKIDLVRYRNGFKWCLKELKHIFPCVLAQLGLVNYKNLNNLNKDNPFVDSDLFRNKSHPLYSRFYYRIQEKYRRTFHIIKVDTYAIVDVIFNEFHILSKRLNQLLNIWFYSTNLQRKLQSFCLKLLFTDSHTNDTKPHKSNFGNDNTNKTKTKTKNKKNNQNFDTKKTQNTDNIDSLRDAHCLDTLNLTANQSIDRSIDQSFDQSFKSSNTNSNINKKINKKKLKKNLKRKYTSLSAKSNSNNKPVNKKAFTPLNTKNLDLEKSLKDNIPNDLEITHDFSFSTDNNTINNNSVLDNTIQLKPINRTLKMAQENKNSPKKLNSSHSHKNSGFQTLTASQLFIDSDYQNDINDSNKINILEFNNNHQSLNDFINDSIDINDKENSENKNQSDQSKENFLLDSPFTPSSPKSTNNKNSTIKSSNSIVSSDKHFKLNFSKKLSKSRSRSKQKVNNNNNNNTHPEILYASSFVPLSNEKLISNDFNDVSNENTNSSDHDYESVQNNIREIMKCPDFDDGSYAPNLLRLAWHSSATYDKYTKTGGSNGATM